MSLARDPAVRTGSLAGVPVASSGFGKVAQCTNSTDQTITTNDTTTDSFPEDHNVVTDIANWHQVNTWDTASHTEHINTDPTTFTITNTGVTVNAEGCYEVSCSLFFTVSNGPSYHNFGLRFAKGVGAGFIDQFLSPVFGGNLSNLPVGLYGPKSHAYTANTLVECAPGDQLSVYLTNFTNRASFNAVLASDVDLILRSRYCTFAIKKVA